MHITENLIKDYSDDITYKSGLDCYKSGKVINMDVDVQANKYYMFNVYKIDAWVETSDYDEYNININFNDKSGFMNLKCDCQSFHEFNKRKGICKHIVAVLLKYSREYSGKNLKAVDSVKVEKLVRDIRNNMKKASSMKRNINLEIRYYYDRNDEFTSSVEIKLGLERNYVVKNMKDFLRSIESGEVIEFGKGFTFNPTQNKFNEDDKKIIDLFLESIEIDSRSNSTNSFSNNGMKIFSGKKIYLMDKQLSRFFNFIQGRYIEANIQGVDYCEVQILEEDMPLSFNLKMEKDKILLLHTSEMPRPLSSNGRFYFYRNNIYSPSSEQLKVYVPFYNAFMNERTYHLTFNKEDGDKIASYILPGLKKISSSVVLDKNLEKEFYEEPLKVKVYLDKEKENAAANLIFSYGNIDINPLNEGLVKNENGILIRDIPMELSIVTFMESYGFERENDKYILKDEEKLVAFLNEGLAELQESGEVFYSEAFKSIKIYGSSSYRSSVRLNEEDLLEFTFDIEGVDKEELKHIFRAMKEKKKYYKLKKGGFVSLEEDKLRSISNIIEYLDIKDSDLGTDKILLAKYNALYIDQILKDNDMSYVEKNKRFQELASSVKDIKDMEYALPEHLDKVMRGYQKIGFNWFKALSIYGFGGILADEMGLGKTLQTIAFITTERGDKPSLVVAPTSLVYNWRSEIEKFAPELKTLVVYGNKKEREELRKEIEDADVVITSYPLIRRDIEDYKEIEFKYCFLDEAQQIKNPASINAVSVKEIRAKGFFALTGTPIENSLTELWSIFDFVMPGYLMNHGRFVQKYENPIAKNKDQKALEALNKHIKPFILRRLKI